MFTAINGVSFDGEKLVFLLCACMEAGFSQIAACVHVCVHMCVYFNNAIEK